MGMYIEIEGDYPCAKCGRPLTGWQSKELAIMATPWSHCCRPLPSCRGWTARFTMAMRGATISPNTR